MDKKYISIDVLTGYDCNFRCKYCFEQLSTKNYKSMTQTDDITENTIKYIENVCDMLKDNYVPSISFYGGEPFLHIDLMSKYLRHFRRNIKTAIITNGTLIDKNKDWLKYMQKISKNNISIAVSYDYSLQNTNRQKRTYELVRNNISWLFDNDFNTNTISVLPMGDFQYFYDMFMDFIELNEKYPKLKFVYNIDRVNASKTQFNEEKTIQSFEKLNKYLKENNCFNKIIYNGSCGYKNDRIDCCIWGNVYSGIDIDGTIYPAYNMCYERNKLKEMFNMGTVFDTFEEQNSKRNAVMSKLKFNDFDACRKCNAPCRVQPWRTIKTDISEFDAMPSEEHCNIHKLLAKYLTEN